MGPSQQKQQQLANVVSKVTQIQEELVEQEIEKYDTILKKTNDGDDNASRGNDNNSNDADTDPIIQQWRQKRMLEYQGRQQELISCRQTYGHGEYMELGGSHGGSNHNTIDIAQEFFSVCKSSQRVVLHCYRPTTELCDTFHTHLQSLATTHIETRFMKFNVQDYDDTATKKRGQTDNIAMKFLIEKLQIRIMPTLILIQNQQIIHRIEGCTELNNSTQFSTNMLAYVLGHKYHMIYPTPEEIPDQVLSSSSSTAANTKSYKSKYLTGGAKGIATRYRYNQDDEDDDDYEDF
jgi:hypothetical protein